MSSWFLFELDCGEFPECLMEIPSELDSKLRFVGLAYEGLLFVFEPGEIGAASFYCYFC